MPADGTALTNAQPPYTALYSDGLSGLDLTTAVLVSVDRTPPTLTGSPGEGDIVSSLRPPLVVEYSDELSGVAPGTLQVSLDGTDVTAQFETFPAGALWVPTEDLPLARTPGR